VISMVEQACTGALAASPLSRTIWDGLLGATGSPAIAPGGKPVSVLPVVKPSQPTAQASATPARATPTPSHTPASPSSSPDVLPSPSASRTRANR
jgi:hypothetical protein